MDLIFFCFFGVSVEAVALMGGRMSTVAPEPRAPQAAHRRAEGPAHARAGVDRPRSAARRAGGPRAAPPDARADSYGAAAWSLSDVEEDARLAEAHELAARRGDLRAARARQLAVLSEVSVVGQEFGWAAQQASPGAAGAAGAGAAPKPAAGVLCDHAAGVFAAAEAGSRRASSRAGGAPQRSGRDTAAELRRFLKSRAGSDGESDDGGEEEEAGCPRSPAMLQDWSAPLNPGGGGSSGRRTRGRPMSAPLAAARGLGVGGGGGQAGGRGGSESVAAQLRREIAASEARTHAL